MEGMNGSDWNQSKHENCQEAPTAELSKRWELLIAVNGVDLIQRREFWRQSTVDTQHLVSDQLLKLKIN
jgi:hypothetical protein